MNNITAIINAFRDYDSRVENVEVEIRPIDKSIFYNVAFSVPYCFIPYPETHFLQHIQSVLPETKNVYCGMITIDNYNLSVKYVIRL